MEIPNRYQKNIPFLGEDGFAILRRSRVTIVGAGGLGGTVFEALLRYGVGHLTILDFDDFDETNLNRQLLSSMATLGQNKAIAAVERARLVNPAVEVTATAHRLTKENAVASLDACDLVCDCLGNIRDRFILEGAARTLKVPLVHAAVAGERGQISTLLPDGPGFESIYGPAQDAPASGREMDEGTPTSAVMTIAALQAHEAVRVLTGKKPSLAGTLLLVNLTHSSTKRVRLA